MKALSVRQPWAGLIAAGVKRVELRSWYTDHRGPLLICASKQRDRVPCLVFDGRLPHFCDVSGSVLCVVNLFDVREARGTDDELACTRVPRGLYAWRFADAKPLTNPFPITGKLGLFEVALDLPGLQT